MAVNGIQQGIAHMVLCRYKEFWPVREDAQDKHDRRMKIKGQPANPD